MSIRDDLAFMISSYRPDYESGLEPEIELAEAILERFAVLEYREPDRTHTVAIAGRDTLHATWELDHGVAVDNAGVIQAPHVYVNVLYDDDPTLHCAAVMSAYRHALEVKR